MLQTQKIATRLVDTESSLAQLVRARYEALASVSIVTKDGLTIHIDLDTTTPNTGVNSHFIEAAEHHYQRLWEWLYEVAEAEGTQVMKFVQAIREQQS